MSFWIIILKVYYHIPSFGPLLMIMSLTTIHSLVTNQGRRLKRVISLRYLQWLALPKMRDYWTLPIWHSCQAYWTISSKSKFIRRHFVHNLFWYMTFWYRKNWETCSAYNFLGDFSDVEYEGQLKINADKIKEFYFGNKDINLDDETFSNLTIVIGKWTRVNSFDARRRVVYYHKGIC
jgi:hypothetical protein